MCLPFDFFKVCKLYTSCQIPCFGAVLAGYYVLDPVQCLKSQANRIGRQLLLCGWFAKSLIVVFICKACCHSICSKWGILGSSPIFKEFLLHRYLNIGGGAKPLLHVTMKDMVLQDMSLFLVTWLNFDSTEDA